MPKTHNSSQGSPVLEGRTERLETALAASDMDAETKKALRDLQQRCNGHADSKLRIIPRGNDSDLTLQLEQAAAGLVDHYVSQQDPPLIYNDLMGRPARVVTETSAGETRFRVAAHIEASLRVETAVTAFWLDKDGGKLILLGETPTAESVREVSAIPHGEVVFSVPGKPKSAAGYWALRGPSRGHPNPEAVGSLLANPLPGVPVISAVRQHPALLPDASRIVSTDGYHPGLGVELVGSPPLTPMTPEAALAELKHTYGSFPYSTGADWAATLAMLLSLIIAPASGKRPLFLITKPRPRTGATLLAQAASIGVAGGAATMLAPPEREDSEETGKGLTATAVSASGMILLDNFDAGLGSHAFEAYFTAYPLYQARPFGKNDRLMTVDRTWLLEVATGNGVRLTPAMAGRVMLIDLDARVPNPAERAFDFDPTQRASERRSHIVSALCALVQHWIDAGQPDAGRRQIRPEQRTGGFDPWENLVADILHAAGLVDEHSSNLFLGNRAAVKARTDEDFIDLLVRAWFDAHGLAAGLTAGQIVEAGQGLDWGRADTDAKRRQHVGYQLKRWASRTYAVGAGETVRVVSEYDGHTKTAHYRLVRT